MARASRRDRKYRVGDRVFFTYRYYSSSARLHRLHGGATVRAIRAVRQHDGHIRTLYSVRCDCGHLFEVRVYDISRLDEREPAPGAWRPRIFDRDYSDYRRPTVLSNVCPRCSNRVLAEGGCPICGWQDPAYEDARRSIIHAVDTTQPMTVLTTWSSTR